MLSQHQHLVLASASPRRRIIMEQLGIPFDVITINVQESHLPDEKPEDHVARLSLEKAIHGQKILKEISRHPVTQSFHQPQNRSSGQYLVLGADTIVVLNGMILGKPRDTEDAQRMLGMLAGRSHTVFTGLTLLGENDIPRDSRVAKTDVELRKLTAEEICGYVRTGEPMDKAGAYAVQGIGAGLVRRINGCFYNVVGLPVGLLLDMLSDAGGKLVDYFSLESSHKRT